ncbi:MAG: hypothetical protein ACFHHU_03275 [Porticoccaceae bacterium]
MDVLEQWCPVQCAAFPWLFEHELMESNTAAKLRAMRMVGVPYTDEDIGGAADQVAGVTEAEALIAYLQQLGHCPQPTACQEGGDGY